MSWEPIGDEAAADKVAPLQRPYNLQHCAPIKWHQFCYPDRGIPISGELCRYVLSSIREMAQSLNFSRFRYLETKYIDRSIFGRVGGWFRLVGCPRPLEMADCHWVVYCWA